MTAPNNASQAQLISTATIGHGSKRVIAGVIGGMCLFIIVSSLLSEFLLIGAGIAVLVLLLTWRVLTIKVTTEASQQNIVVRCHPFYSKSIPMQHIVDASPAPSSSLTEGYGIRYLGQGTWGLLVGGPAINIETTNRTWIISTPDPESTAAAILAHSHSSRPS